MRALLDLCPPSVTYVLTLCAGFFLHDVFTVRQKGGEDALSLLKSPAVWQLDLKRVTWSGKWEVGNRAQIVHMQRNGLGRCRLLKKPLRILAKTHSGKKSKRSLYVQGDWLQLRRYMQSIQWGRRSRTKSPEFQLIAYGALRHVPICKDLPRIAFGKRG